MSAPVHPARSLWPAWLFLAVAGIGYALWDLLQWVLAWRGAGDDYDAARTSFLQHVPFATPMAAALATIAAGVLGVIGAVALTRSPTRGLRRLGLALVAVGSPLLFWRVWTVM